MEIEYIEDEDEQPIQSTFQTSESELIRELLEHFKEEYRLMNPNDRKRKIQTRLRMKTLQRRLDKIAEQTIYID